MCFEMLWSFYTNKLVTLFSAEIEVRRLTVLQVPLSWQLSNLRDRNRRLKSLTAAPRNMEENVHDLAAPYVNQPASNYLPTYSLISFLFYIPIKAKIYN